MTDLDAIRAAMADAMHATDCGCRKTMDVHHTPDVPQWYGDLADAALRAIAPTLDRLRDTNGKLALTIQACPEGHHDANLAHARAERDQLRAEVERLRREQSVELANAEARADVLAEQVARLTAELADERDAHRQTWMRGDYAESVAESLAAKLERLKANQLPDGGMWRTEYGHIDGAGGFWSSKPLGTRWADDTHQRRVGYGPVEPIGRDDDPTQPAAALPVVNDVTSTGPAEGDRSGVEDPGPQNRSEGVSVQDAGRRHQFAEYQFAEPDNNCFIPRSRDWPESREKLQQAAHWYGGRFVPGAEAEPQ